MKDHTRALLEHIPDLRPIAGVEVGVYRGLNAFTLLKQRTQLSLHLVDPWKRNIHQEEFGLVGAIRSQANWDIQHICVKGQARGFPGRVHILRMRSAWAAFSMADETFDYVFIDANHIYRESLNDIKLWFPKVREGGFIAGHDYDHPIGESGFGSGWGVKRAVDEFAASRQYNVQLGEGYTWFIYKV